MKRRKKKEKRQRRTRAQPTKPLTAHKVLSTPYYIAMCISTTVQGVPPLLLPAVAFSCNSTTVPPPCRGHPKMEHHHISHPDRRWLLALPSRSTAGRRRGSAAQAQHRRRRQVQHHLAIADQFPSSFSLLPPSLPSWHELGKAFRTPWTALSPRRRLTNHATTSFCVCYIQRVSANNMVDLRGLTNFRQRGTHFK